MDREKRDLKIGDYVMTDHGPGQLVEEILADTGSFFMVKPFFSYEYPVFEDKYGNLLFSGSCLSKIRQRDVFVWISMRQYT